jgi:phage repressor protein C with HTH and peptisase S24 domain
MKSKPPNPRRTKANAEADYRSAFAQRLKRAAENHEIAQIAAQIGVRPATLYRWLSARFDPSLPKLADFATATNSSLGWLVSGYGPPDLRRAANHALLEEHVAIDFEPAEAKASKAPLAFHEPWLFQLLYGSGQEPKLLGAMATPSPPLLLEVGEDSMEPTIAKGDLLLVDRSFALRPTESRGAEHEARSWFDGIYVFRSRASRPNADSSSTARLLVRRIQYRLDGTMVVRCDNPKYPEEVYPPNAPNPPRPRGRVVWRGGRI